MDFLNKAFSQISDLFKSMTPGARVTAGLLLGLIVVSLGYLVNYRVAGPDAFLFGGQSFDPSYIPAMEAAFAKANLGGYELEGTRFRIPRGQQELYVAALADGNALPPNIHTIFEEANNKSNIFESREQREKREIAAKEKKLSLIIRSMRGIQDAAVTYDRTEKANLRGDKLLTASVAIWSQGAQPLDAQLVPGVRNLVAASIAGLTPDKVTVLDQNTGRSFMGGNSTDSPGASGLGDNYSERKREYELNYQQKFETALAYIPGVIVTTNVELDPQTYHQEKTVNLDPKAAVPVDSEKTTTTNSTQSAAPAGRPGLPAQGGVNAPGAIGSTAGQTNRNEEESDHSHEKFAVGKTETETHKSGLIPQRVTASIAVPTSWYEKIWHEKNPAAAGEQPKKPDPKELDTIAQDENQRIRDSLLTVIPMQAGVVPDQTPLIKVVAYQHIPPAAIAGPSVAENTLAWLGNSWSTLGMILLGLFGLVMLRSMVRSAQQSQAIAPPATLPFIADETRGEKRDKDDQSPEGGSSPRKRRSGEPTKKDELVDMVREDPDAAANILRNWISNAS